MAAFNTILVPTDFSKASEKALEYAREIADAFGASIHVIHVIENPFAPGAFMEVYAPPEPDELMEQVELKARAHLDNLFTQEDRARYRVVLTTPTGVPADRILKYLDETPGIDLVVMASAGRGGVARFLMGSVADKIVRQARCPVLTVHPHRGAAPDYKAARLSAVSA
jgi:nucleotide-binding universal stress UspA family protein